MGEQWWWGAIGAVMVVGGLLMRRPSDRKWRSFAVGIVTSAGWMLVALFVIAPLVPANVLGITILIVIVLGVLAVPLIVRLSAVSRGSRGVSGRMTEYRHTATIEMPAADLFAYLREPRNLPRYFPQMSRAEPEGGEAVHVEADVHGEHVEGEAWLKVDEANRSLRWGAQGPHDYQGELSIEDAGPAASRLTVTLHSVRDADDETVQRGLEETVAALAHTVTADADVDAAEKEGGWAGHRDS